MLHIIITWVDILLPTGIFAVVFYQSVPPIDLIVTRLRIAHLSLYTRLRPTCDKKVGIMGRVYILNQWACNCQARGPRFKPWRPIWFLNFFIYFNSNKKIIAILTKILAKITIIVVENREPYYFIIIYKRKEVPLSLFFYQILASTFDSDEWSSHYKVYGSST